jgi:hypothetical protein
MFTVLAIVSYLLFLEFGSVFGGTAPPCCPLRPSMVQVCREPGRNPTDKPYAHLYIRPYNWMTADARFAHAATMPRIEDSGRAC